MSIHINATDCKHGKNMRIAKEECSCLKRLVSDRWDFMSSNSIFACESMLGSTVCYPNWSRTWYPPCFCSLFLFLIFIFQVDCGLRLYWAEEIFLAKSIANSSSIYSQIPSDASYTCTPNESCGLEVRGSALEGRRSWPAAPTNEHPQGFLPWRSKRCDQCGEHWVLDEPPMKPLQYTHKWPCGGHVGATQDIHMYLYLHGLLLD